MGFTENFNKSNYPCDLCFVNQDEMQNILHENMFKPRTEALYDQHIHELQASGLTVSECGIKEHKDLHHILNESADATHDCFSGILP